MEDRLGEALDRLIEHAEVMGKPDDVKKSSDEKAKLPANDAPKPPSEKK